MFHPAGQIGRKLIRVGESDDVPPGRKPPRASDQLTVGQVLHEVSTVKRRSGAVILIDAYRRLSGIFSDGDLRRLVTDNDGSALNRPINQVMTRSPKRIAESALGQRGDGHHAQFRIDELPVVDGEEPARGVVDVQGPGCPANARTLRKDLKSHLPTFSSACAALRVLCSTITVLIRKALFILLPLVLLIGAFFTYFRMQPHSASPRTQKAAAINSKIFGGEGQFIRPAKAAWVKQFDRQGQLYCQFKSDYYNPQPDGNVKVTQPVIQFYLSQDQVLQIVGKEGVIRFNPGMAENVMANAPTIPRDMEPSD